MRGGGGGGGGFPGAAFLGTYYFCTQVDGPITEGRREGRELISEGL